MLKINEYILEKLHITKNYGNKKLFFPDNKDELVDLLKRLIPERGNNANLNDIDVNKITDMSYLFSKYDHIENIDISEWDVSNVTVMNNMFRDCKRFNSDLGDWDVSNVKDMRSMFQGCASFTGQGIENWDTRNVETMEGMLAFCKKFNNDISHWDVSNVKTFSSMFENAITFNKDLSNWNISNSSNTRWMFLGCESLKYKPHWYIEL